MNAGHCPTCTCPAEKASDWPWCLSVLYRRHEAIACYLPADHEGLHSSGVVAQPCASCGGVELHRPDCPLGGETVSSDDPPFEVTWADDDPGVLVQEPFTLGMIIGVTYRPDQWEFRYDPQTGEGEYVRIGP